MAGLIAGHDKVLSAMLALSISASLLLACSNSSHPAPAPTSSSPNLSQQAAISQVAEKLCPRRPDLPTRNMAFSSKYAGGRWSVTIRSAPWDEMIGALFTVNDDTGQ